MPAHHFASSRKVLVVFLCSASSLFLWQLLVPDGFDVGGLPPLNDATPGDESGKGGVDRNNRRATDTHRGRVLDGYLSKKLQWKGGGVSSRDVEKVQDFFSGLAFRSRLPLTSFFNATIGLDLIRNISREIVAASEQDSDCLFQLLPHHRAACVVAAMIESNLSASGMNSTAPDLWGPLPALGGDDWSGKLKWRLSYCATMLPCITWRRGTFNPPLSHASLAAAARRASAQRATSSSAVNEKKKPRAFVSDHASRLTSLFVHDRSTSPELALRRILRRHAVHEQYASFRAARAGRLSRRRSDGGDDRSLNMSEAFWGGHSLRVDKSRDFIPVMDTIITSDYLLSPMEMIGILHQRVLMSSRSGSTERHSSLPIGHGIGLRDTVLVFSGDSMTRQLFMRLIALVRGGSAWTNRSDGDEVDERPFGIFEPSQAHDMIYSVYATHDDLVVCHSPYSDREGAPDGPATVSGFLRREQEDVNTTRTNHSAHSMLPELLLRVVFYWDPQEAEYRRSVYPPSSFRLHSTAKEQRQTIRKASSLALAGRVSEQHAAAEQLCNRLRTLRSPDGRVMQIGGSNGAKDGMKLLWGNHGLSLKQQQLCKVIDETARKIKPPRASRNIVGSSLSAVGVRRAMHVVGHLFWDNEHNIELLDHLAAASLAQTPTAVGNNASSVRDAASTDLVVLSATIADISEPWLRRTMADDARGGGDDRTQGRFSRNETSHSTAGDEDSPPISLSEVHDNIHGGKSVVHVQGGPKEQVEADDKRRTQLSESSVFRNLPMHIPINKHNLRKNLVLMEWLRVVLMKRADLTRSQSRRWEHVDDLSMLDMAKIQLLQFPQSDDRHFTCRFGQVVLPARFERSFDEHTLRILLSKGTIELDLAPLTPLDRAVHTEWLVQHVNRYLFNSPQAQFRGEMWTMSGLYEAEKHFSRENVLFMSNTYEYGVLLYDDLARCRDPANHLALQILALRLARRMELKNAFMG